MTRLAFAAIAAFPLVALAQQKEVDALLAADRAYSAASAKTDLVTGLSAMFASDVFLQNGPTRSLVRGRDKTIDALRAVPANAGAKVEWWPVRAGISADGTQGFSFGFMTMHRADGTDLPLKYLAYWVREGNEWKVAAYKRAGRPPGEVSMEMMAPSLPERLVAPTADPSVMDRHKQAVAAAEQAFSDESEVIGLGPAFARWGHADAMNIGTKAGFTIGAREIAQGVEPPPAKIPGELKWKADHVIAASSGDLGVSLGYIQVKTDPGRAPMPFFTVWRKGTDGKWRYIAE